ncbi:MAG: hypothetical protein WCR60_03505 [Patescibacteria group bacterium]
MTRKIFVFSIVLVLASLLAACGLSEQQRVQVSDIVDEAVEKIPTPQQPIINVESAEQPAPIINIEVPEQPAPIVNVTVPEQPAPIVNVTMAEVEKPVAQESVVNLILPECPLEDQGSRIDFTETLEKENGFYILSSELEQLADYAGCNILIEGRQQLNEEHHIWLYLGGQWELPVREGSLWVYPTGWNMDNFAAEKAPIATEFVVAKRHNQLQNGYDWPIYVHTLSGNVVLFPEDSELPEVELPNNADFLEPESIVIHGIWDSKTTAFNASIGAEGATTVALLDGQLYYWAEAQDNVVYKNGKAWLMPSTWEQSQIESWAEAQFPEMELQPYAP